MVADDEPRLEFPAGVGAAYETLARSILAEDMPTFMKLFHRDFIYESQDGAALDREAAANWANEIQDATLREQTLQRVERR